MEVKSDKRAFPLPSEIADAPGAVNERVTSPKGARRLRGLGNAKPPLPLNRTGAEVASAI
jgi:hypothetical protein